MYLKVQHYRKRNGKLLEKQKYYAVSPQKCWITSDETSKHVLLTMSYQQNFLRTSNDLSFMEKVQYYLNNHKYSDSKCLQLLCLFSDTMVTWLVTIWPLTHPKANSPRVTLLLDTREVTSPSTQMCKYKMSSCTLSTCHFPWNYCN